MSDFNDTHVQYCRMTLTLRGLILYDNKELRAFTILTPFVNRSFANQTVRNRFHNFWKLIVRMQMFYRQYIELRDLRIDLLRNMMVR